MYIIMVTAVSCYLIAWVAPTHGTTNVFIYVGICSLVGSLSVMSVKVCDSLNCSALLASVTIHLLHNSTHA